MSLHDIKSVAIIGAGPAGAIAIDALAQEKAFERIRVFERREKAGGCWCVLFPSVHMGPNHSGDSNCSPGSTMKANHRHWLTSILTPFPVGLQINLFQCQKISPELLLGY